MCCGETGVGRQLLSVCGASCLGEMDALTGRCTALRHFTINKFITINQYIDG